MLTSSFRARSTVSVEQRIRVARVVRDGQQVLWLLAYLWSRANARTAVGLMGASSIHSGMMAKYASAVSCGVVCSSMTAVCPFLLSMLPATVVVARW